MVSGINSNASMQQMQQMNQMHRGQGMGQFMQILPQDEKENLQQTLKSMDETQRKDVVSKLKELDVNNLSQDELMKQIQDILNPNSSTSQSASSLAHSFSIYA